ncbi:MULTISPECIES: hypothetical protein [Pseudoalteromonas]|uniref:Orphan protein n=2 Tax=Pseudoalteromonas TaxID=53246 RepID=Q3IL88_PSET1|nr:MULTISPECIES: hypothetical protein [Pseudoalteromonas]ASM53967.1 hypothetical protein PNIG_a1877 [Pseudoalteromonas nigrifaciens]MBB1370850.1 hypothetical protein [Pseudoalteromonas sp. SR45-4]MBB1404401.1 hypothetical protein [Pseudoalteromonas sp. SG44-5]MBE0421288.1 hypothetical protein [Pseudoalteromonas nigrifaciens]MBH0093382.1 hypothetical protein [Pseudoalteromonas sp. SCQQ13]|tara:strand:+ start:16090 stop:16467 length:378 start_codon:yes stop_codon:yes gene_type:complete
MGNLFLREKESWLAWSFWGAIGAFITLYVAMSTSKAHFIVASSMGVLVVLTWWMQQSKRYDFGRAFKICCYVLLLTVLPAFLVVVVPSDDLNRFDLIFQSATFLTLSLFVCLLCSWIARRPKQYY